MPVSGTIFGGHSIKFETVVNGFLMISQESPGEGKILLHYSAAKSFAKDVLFAAKEAEAAYKIQAQ